ncbi:SIS domain-containing protein [Actinomadura syzygii]|uniref:Glutamine--fructose-6-phosphate aminotransferase [isomerizing] n=1 Tax=Actinomadura syzygii TaxID=1427538 RepID=A0A5D0UGP4_9ACTN|nr:SIS domain-containing protein [Actinomadura syzygii]TYC17568.1 SIS domain-containing protein [Actinomadura syzygii]
MTVDDFHTEIIAQPAALERAAAAMAEQAAELDALRALAARRPIVLTGMGASYHACLAAASTLGRAGVLATTVNTAELTHFRMRALAPGTVVVAISQSGRSAELVRLSGALDRRTRLVTITNGLGNPLAEAADIAFDTRAGAEHGPSTGTFAATFPPLAALVRTLGGEAGSGAVIEEVASLTATAAEQARRVLGGEAALTDAVSGWLGDRTGAVLVGRGTGRAAADLGALVLKEAARLAAECLDAAEFRHGPLELAGPELAAAVIATEPATRDLDLALAAELAVLGGPVLLVTAEGAAPYGVTPVAVGAVDPLLAPAVAAIPFQLLAWALAVAGGREPGRFTIGSKITTKE